MYACRFILVCKLLRFILAVYLLTSGHLSYLTFPVFFELWIACFPRGCRIPLLELAPGWEEENKNVHSKLCWQLTMPPSDSPLCSKILGLLSCIVEIGAALSLQPGCALVGYNVFDWTDLKFESEAPGPY